MDKKEKEILQGLLENGYDRQEIQDAMCDGEFLKEESITQLQAESIYDFLAKATRSIK